LPAAIIAAVVFVAIDEPVFFTKSGSYAGSVFFTTTISFVRAGRDAGMDFTLSGCVTMAAGGKLVGWLDVGLTILCRSCADAELVKHTAANNAHTDRKRIFLKAIKSKTPVYLFFRGQI